MGSLRFSFGTMSSGKSTLALQIHHNLSGTSTGLLCSMHDRAGAQVSSALGVSTPAIEVDPALNFESLALSHRASYGALDYLVCDEAQFYTDSQVEQLARVVDEMDVDVYAFGLLTDFRGKLFPGSARLLEIADQRHELQVQARCWCGESATHNARLHDGVQVYDGDVVLIDDGSTAKVTYELRCRNHWISGQAGPIADRYKAAG
tara:strand:- start:724 stop:1338 length:615 start_codon:yes stop_codon:yes gene_type:complete